MKRILCIVLAAALLLGLCACGSMRSSEPSASSAAPEAPAASAYDYEAGMPVPEPEEPSGGTVDVKSPIDNGSRKLVYTADYRIASTQFEADLSAISQAVSAAGGYISDRSRSGTAPEQVGDSGRTATINARIPSENFESFCQALGGIGQTTSEDSHVQNISQEYYDSESRIKLLENRYARLEALLKDATKMDDILSIEREMSDVLSQLDVLKGNRRYMDDLVDYSTVEITVSEIVKAGDVVVSKEGTGERAGDAFTATWKALGVAFEEFIIFFVGALPVLIVLAVIAGVVLLIVFLARRGSKRRKAKKAAAPQQPPVQSQPPMQPPQNPQPPQGPQA